MSGPRAMFLGAWLGVGVGVGSFVWDMVLVLGIRVLAWDVGVVALAVGVFIIGFFFWVFWPREEK